ncbi:MAG: helix-turn-helix domain-containing protein [Clostridium sp.]
MKILGERVKKIRNERGMTQEELSKKVFVSKYVISNIERGITKEVKKSIMNLLSYALKCTIEYLTGESEAPQKDKDGLSPAFYILPKWDYNFEIKELLKEYSSDREMECLLREEIYYLKNSNHTVDFKDTGVEILKGIVEILNKEDKEDKKDIKLKILLNIINALK